MVTQQEVWTDLESLHGSMAVRSCASETIRYPAAGLFVIVEIQQFMKKVRRTHYDVLLKLSDKVSSSVMDW